MCVVDVVVFVHRTVVPTTIVTGSGVNEKLIIETAWVAVTPAPVTSPGPGATTKTATEIPRMATVTMVNQIRISPIRLIGADGEQLGVVPTSQALERAREADLDLVEVAPDERPPVFAEKLRLLFDSQYPEVGDFITQAVWAAGDIVFNYGGNFNTFVTSRELTKQEAS